MKIEISDIGMRLREKGLKITPQRIAILEAIYVLNNHPTAENIIDFIRKNHPNIAIGTVYKVLDTLVKKKLVKKVTTERDVMRYDGVMEHHHHLYCVECDLIEDYVDEELNVLLNKYFKDKKLKGFQIKDFVLQINGTFDKC
ncbi:transcriptional repressor [uncultured Draconibacterium sp.]|uniref:Fur family transcriptional regulator n=1 Tax=uncultured Draconibacterium sp. TaxID=1573823 RepID=UPI0025D7CA82|nr:transcriptional repressor [uncultured Draconibacterium sp.]